MRASQCAGLLVTVVFVAAAAGCGGSTSTATERHVDRTPDASAGGASSGGGGTSGAGGRTSGGAIGSGGVEVGGGGGGAGGATPPPNCCKTDADCGDLYFVPCVNGVCKQPTSAGCWSDAECHNGESCVGAIVCGCGSVCKRGDAPGVCRTFLDGGIPLPEASTPTPDAGVCSSANGCPSQWCSTVCCPGGPECAPCCVPKPCQSFGSADCPLDRCQLIAGCNGTKICYPPFTAPPPACGTVGYYGGAVACCSGLVRRCGLPTATGCDMNAGGYLDMPWCLACGDGKCDASFENTCSCPEDCH